MAGQQQDSGGQDKNSYYVLWVLFLIVIVGAVIWYFADVQLKTFFIATRKYELMLAHAVVSWIPTDLIPGFGQMLADWKLKIEADLAMFASLNPDTLTAEAATQLSNDAGEFLRFPIALLLLLISIYVYFTHIGIRFKRRHSMKSLLLQEQENWPQVKIVSKLNLTETDIDSGPWAMAMTPMIYAQKNKLVAIGVAEIEGSGFSKIKEAEFKIVLDKSRAARAFSAQLGRAWQGPQNMPAHRRAIFAVFVARGCRNTQAAQDMVKQLAESAGAGKLDFSGCDALWKKHYNDKTVQRICKSHAYEFTVMASLLLFAREDGVLASADFLWVKPLDRRLWYVINNVGRQTPTTEVAGIFCHWYYELALKRPLSVPIVDNAVVALEIALNEVLYIPGEQEREDILKRYEEEKAKKAAKTEGEAAI